MKAILNIGLRRKDVVDIAETFDPMLFSNILNRFSSSVQPLLTFWNSLCYHETPQETP